MGIDGKGISETNLFIVWLVGETRNILFPTELTSDEDMEIDLGEWRRINVLYECDYVCIS